MKIGGLGAVPGIYRFASGVRPQVAQKQLAHIGDSLVARSSEQYNQSIQAINQFRRAARLETMMRKEAIYGLNQTAEDLDETERLLMRMQDVARTAADEGATAGERQKAQEELQRLMEKLETLTADNKRINGSLGGEKGETGLASMGIEEIRSSGDLQGTAKFYIDITGDKLRITAKIGGETVTNLLSQRDQETTFKLQNGKRITLKFDGGAGNLIGGVVVGVQFKKGQSAADLSRAVSADKLDKAVVPYDGKEMKMPRYIDVSAQALGISNLNLTTRAEAQKALARLDRAVMKVDRLRREVLETRGALARAPGETPEEEPLLDEWQGERERDLLTALARSVEENPTAAISSHSAPEEGRGSWTALLK